MRTKLQSDSKVPPRLEAYLISAILLLSGSFSESLHILVQEDSFNINPSGAVDMVETSGGKLKRVERKALIQQILIEGLI